MHTDKVRTWSATTLYAVSTFSSPADPILPPYAATLDLCGHTHCHGNNKLSIKLYYSWYIIDPQCAVFRVQGVFVVLWSTRCIDTFGVVSQCRGVKVCVPGGWRPAAV